MKIFVDANILISVLNKEYPLFTHSARILSLAQHRNYEVFTSPVCLAIAWYFAVKKHKAKHAREKIKTLCEHISIAETTATSVAYTLKNLSIHDFEDGLEYYTAIENKCQYIITEDVKDFYFSEIPVFNSKDFFEKCVLIKDKRL